MCQFSSVICSNLISSLLLLCPNTYWKVTIASDNCDVVQVILLLFGMEFLWRKSGELIENYGYGPEYEVIRSLFFYLPSIILIFCALISIYLYVYFRSLFWCCWLDNREASRL